MTRPMPGPPEDCYCRDGNATCDDCEAYGYRYSWGLCPGCHLHNGRDLGAHKHLKDVECAAHYWQAFCYRARALAEIINLPPHEARRIVKESDTWHRFDTHHHALEES